MSDARRRVARLRLIDAVETCTRCPLSTTATPVPPVVPEGPTDVLILGDIPTRRDEQMQTAHYPAGPGRHLHDALAEAGADIDRIAFANIVACRPTRPVKADAADPRNRGRADKPVVTERPPTDIERAACRHHVTALIRHCRPAAMLLLGGTALSVFRHDLRLTNVEWRTIRFADFGVVTGVAPHPLTFIRDRDNAGLAEWRHKVANYVGWVLDAIDGRDHLQPDVDRICVKCGVGGQRGVPVVAVDRDGCGYCWRHRNDSKAGEVDSKWRTIDNRQLQTAMF